MADSILYEKDKKEIARYLGYGGQGLEPETEELIEIVAGEAIAVADFRRIYISSSVLRHPAQGLSDSGRSDDGLPYSDRAGDRWPVLEISGKRINSSALSRNLEGCERCYLIAATLGAECDRLMARYTSVSISKAVTFQAVCTWLLEAKLDEFEAELSVLSENSGKTFRPRFSPGYGDLDIGIQSWILRVLDTPRKMGLSLTEGNMLIPSKSVTAFLGVKDRAGGDESEKTSACTSCDKEDCSMRKEG